MALWDDPAVRELYVNPDGQVWANRSGSGRERTPVILDEVSVTKFLGTVAAYRRETLTPERPWLQGAMPMLRFEGARIQGYIPPRAAGPGFNMRKHPSEAYTLDSYYTRGGVSGCQFDGLLAAIDKRRNILVVGPTGTGKTAFLGALIRATTERWPGHRLLVIEDTPEIRCSAPDAVLYRTVPGEKIGMQINTEAMRLTPDRIWCPEYRDRAAFYIANLWMSGHHGGGTSMHAGSLESALVRTNYLMLDGRRGSYARLIADTMNVLVLLEIGADGLPRCADFALVDGLDRRGRFFIRRPETGTVTRSDSL